MGIIDELKSVADLAHEVKSIPLYEKLLSMTSQVYELLDENRTLREEVRNLKERLELRESLRFEKNCYWLDKDGRREGPYCPKCYSGESAIRQMIKFDFEFGCPTCGFLVHQDGKPIDDYRRAERLGSTLPGWVERHSRTTRSRSR